MRGDLDKNYDYDMFGYACIRIMIMISTNVWIRMMVTISLNMPL